MVLTKRRYTYDDWLDSPDNHPLAELVNGEPVERMSTTPDHDSVVDELRSWLRRAQQAGHGRAFGGPTAVLLDATGARKNAREPDVCFVRRERLHIVTSRTIEGIPDLAIEVLSSGNRLDDLPGGPIWDDYERFAVPAYWIGDIDTRIVAQYAWREGRYEQPVLLGQGDTLRSQLFPGIELSVRDLFAYVLQPGRPLSERDRLLFRAPGGG